MMADELNAKEVPAVTAPVLVTESEGLAVGKIKAMSIEGEKLNKLGTGARKNVPVIPRLQPLMKAPAIARTSWGRRGMSNDWGIVVAPAKMFSVVWWRDSMVTMEAAAVRTFGSWMRCAAPRYAPTPTFSTTRAIAAMVETSTRALEKSNVQPEGAFSPNEVRIACGPRG